MIIKKSVNIFISSKNSINNYDFNVNLPDNIIKCNGNEEYITINVLSFDMINSMYNVYSGSNTIVLSKYTIGVLNYSSILTIPVGNYNVITFMKKLNELLLNIINVSYNTAQNTFTYNKVIDDNSVYEIDVLKMGNYFGIDNILTISNNESIYTGSCINMVKYNKIILSLNNVNYDFGTLDNLNKDKTNTSSILLWVSRQDIEPYLNISYNNCDGGQNYNMKLYDDIINTLSFRLTNEYGELILDAPEIFMCLQVNIIEKEKTIIQSSLISINKHLENMYFLMLWVLKLLNIV